MPKAILEFNLPEDQSEYKIANQARDMHSAIWEVYNILRSKHKHGEYKTKEARDLMEEIYREFCDEMDEFII